jgi:uncharacterized phage protein (TIGR02218 family)/uncharacterized protein (TIGR02217 family)
MLNGTTEVLTLIEEYGMSVTYEYKNNIKETLVGGDYINAQWTYPIAKIGFQVAWFLQNDFEYVKGFFNHVLGSANTFLFIDSVDCYATRIAYNTGLGIITQGVVIEKDGIYQLAKRYTLQTGSGNYSIDRPITRPMENGITLYNNSGVVVSVGVDWDKGLLSSGGVATWEGSFYLPVRFENDLFPTKFLVKNIAENKHIYSIPDLKLIEIKENDTEYPVNVNVSYNHYWQIPLPIGFDINRKSKTDIFTSESGYEINDDLNTIKTEIILPSQLLYKNQKEYVIGLWRVCLGTFAHIFVRDLDCLIDDEFHFSDTISIDTVSNLQNSGFQLFNLNNVIFREDNNPIKTPYCYCWVIERKDGIKKGFTNHDKKLTINTIVHSPQGSFQATSPTRTSELNADSTELSSVFTIEVTEEDLITDKYLDAKLIVFLYDWFSDVIVSQLYQGNINGYAIGYLPTKAKDYQLDILSLSEKLNKSQTMQTSSSCRAKFLSQGIGNCNRLINGDVRGTRTITVTNLEGDRLFLDPSVDTNYAYGSLRFTSGVCTGLEIYITAVLGGSEIRLLYPPATSPSVGDTVEITRGCDKTTTACKNYGNIANFRGEPRLPGIDGVANTANF